MLGAGIPALPALDSVAERYRAFGADLAGGSRAAWLATLRDWDVLRRELRTWSSLTQLRFDQDTTDAAARRARTARDELQPKFTALEIALKRRFVGSDERASMQTAIGPQAFRLWEADIATFDPAIESDLIRESALRAEYTSLIAGINVPFARTTLNLPGLAKFASDPDRAVRYGATRARWAAFEERGPDLDRIYDDLVRVRTGIARTLGFADFTALAYRRMHRVDYDRADVERYRESVRTDVVPVAAAVAAGAARLHGIERLALWDEALLGGPHNPVPQGDAGWIMERTIESFTDLHPQLGAFARLMNAGDLTDLATRAGKAGGGYCTMLPSYGVPFIFTNFNGTQDDVRVLMHELGHAFQAWSSRDLAVVDYVTPTYESAEIHSMSLEFLSWPFMERFFGDAAETYRRNHLAAAMMFLPYGVAVDHFQHLVYERPEASPAERHAMWAWVEERYLPWRAYGDLARPAAGAFWQSQQHIYSTPFYYIDYTLALCCALQFWAASGDAPEATLERYLALCARGGGAAFRELLGGAGLRSPFALGVLRDAVGRAKDVLGV